MSYAGGQLFDKSQSNIWPSQIFKESEDRGKLSYVWTSSEYVRGIWTQALAAFQLFLHLVLRTAARWCFRIDLLVNIYSLCPGTSCQGCGMSLPLPEWSPLSLSQVQKGHWKWQPWACEEQRSVCGAQPSSRRGWSLLFCSRGLLHSKMAQAPSKLQIIPDMWKTV